MPPVRCKKKKKSSHTSQQSQDNTEEKPSKAKRISSYDYASWDKFDVVSFYM